MTELAARTREYLLTPARGWFRFLFAVLVVLWLSLAAFSDLPLWIRALLAITAVGVIPSLMLGFRHPRASRP